MYAMMCCWSCTGCCRRSVFAWISGPSCRGSRICDQVPVSSLRLPVALRGLLRHRTNRSTLENGHLAHIHGISLKSCNTVDATLACAAACFIICFGYCALLWVAFDCLRGVVWSRTVDIPLALQR